jgi:DNA-binding IclR family transcriptional regulator
MTQQGVKSALRSLEVMEFFADYREANVMSVARALGYPQSSTSQLLHSLSEVGHLRYDARRRTFSVGARAGLWGSTLSHRVFGVHDVAGLVEEVAAATGRETHLCDVIAAKAHYLIGSAWRPNPRAPVSLLESAAGLLFLASMSDEDAFAYAAPCTSDADTLASALRAIRGSAYAVRADSTGTELAISLGRWPGSALSLYGARFSTAEQETLLARRLREMVRSWRDRGRRNRRSPCQA